MSDEEQVDLWVSGKAVHNGLHRSDGVCCPDFSCCNPGMMWPMARRVAFKNGSEEVRTQMAMQALGELMDYHEKRRVHITGG